MPASAASPPAEPTSRSWRPLDAVVALGTTVFVSVSTASLGMIVLGSDASPFSIYLCAQTGLWGTMIGSAWWVSRLRGSGSLRVDFEFRIRGRDIPAGVALGAGVQIVLVPALYFLLSPLLDASAVPDAAEKTIKELGSGWNIAPLAICLILVAPTVEEIFYRGFVLRSFGERWGATVAVMGSALLFAASHLQAVQFPGLFGFGLILAVLRVRFGRLGPAIFTHMGFNAVTVTYIVAMSRG